MSVEKDEAYWAKLHIASDRSKAVPLKPTLGRSVKSFSECWWHKPVKKELSE